MARMERNDELRLPTVAVPVKLTLVGRPAIDAELFVADGTRTGRTQLLDDLATMLDEPTEFLPVRRGGKVRLYPKSAVAVVAVARREHDDEADFDDTPSEVITLYDRQHRVIVELVSGGALAGTLFDSSPSDRPRVVDHLNRTSRFVRLWTPEDHFLINKDQILAVGEQE
jgi:hypothetical protein